MCKVIYKKEFIKKLLVEKLNKEQINFEPDNMGYGYIDDSFSSVFECMCEAITELTGNTIE